MSKSVRIDDDVLERIINEVAGKTLSDKLRALMDRRPATASAAPPEPNGDLLQKIYERDGRIENMVEELLSLGVSSPLTPEIVDPVSIPGVQRGPAGDFNHCVHCGQDYPRPAGQRPSSMCDTCRGAGHWNTGACRPCAEAKHLASVAAADPSGSGRDDIVYDA